MTLCCERISPCRSQGAIGEGGDSLTLYVVGTGVNVSRDMKGGGGRNPT